MPNGRNIRNSRTKLPRINREMNVSPCKDGGVSLCTAKQKAKPRIRTRFADSRGSLGFPAGGNRELVMWQNETTEHRGIGITRLYYRDKRRRRRRKGGEATRFFCFYREIAFAYVCDAIAVAGRDRHAGRFVFELMRKRRFSRTGLSRRCQNQFREMK